MPPFIKWSNKDAALKRLITQYPFRQVPCADAGETVDIRDNLRVLSPILSNAASTLPSPNSTTCRPLG